MGGALGLDFGAVMAMGTALGADTALLAEVLPAAEYAIVKALAPDRDDEPPETGYETA